MSTSDNKENLVTFETLALSSGKNLGLITLNSEKTLNSLNLEMVDLLQSGLCDWEDDDDIACVFLQGAGDKAFCAGGDVVAMHNASAAYGEVMSDDYIETFFTREYAVDFHIHSYKKPFIVWGNGIVMGGGLGLMSGASHRVVTESTRMAMPEITIGLFPDVGGTYFLNHAPGRSGLFLGLTGASFNATDARFVGLADRFIPHAEKQAVLDALCAANWEAGSEAGVVSQVLRKFEQSAADANIQQPPAQIQSHLDWINDICDADDTETLVKQITAYDGEDQWLQKAARTLARGCPVTPFLVVEQMRRGKHLSLADIFRMELCMAVNCGKQGHFKEGVRALLVDKDRNPKWTPASVSAVSAADIDCFFEAPWASSTNPLAALGLPVSGE